MKQFDLMKRNDNRIARGVRALCSAIETNRAPRPARLAWKGIFLAALGLTCPALASLNIPSDGSDGTLMITNNTVIDLSQAVTANWDANNSANAGKGIYDPAKWAVVFKYASVSISSGVTVTFKNHGSRAPVVWLVQSNVTISGTVTLDGAPQQTAPTLAEPGPGGFRGGCGHFSEGVTQGSGFGPGGGSLTQYTRGGKCFCNPSLLPLIGGSGGAGYNDGGTKHGGGAGGGAILIACAGSINLTGTLRANGGAATTSYYQGAGSGGGVRLVAGSLSGNGAVQAVGGESWGTYNPGESGRIRIERTANSSLLSIEPDPSVVTLADGSTPAIWLPDSGPSVTVVSVGGISIPSDPRAGFGAIGADITLPQTSSTTVVLVTTNVESASQVIVRTTPRSSGGYTDTTASVDQILSASPSIVRWKATVPVNMGYSAMIVKVIRP